MRSNIGTIGALGAAILFSGLLATVRSQNVESADATQLDRARREVKLLDDVYKSAIVLITKHYVDESSDLAAGEAFKVLFLSMKEKGWHEVRLLDATGEPLNDVNRPQDDFEREAIKAVLDGKPYFEQIATQSGAKYLRAATTLPVVMDKCVMCHENYRDRKLAAGALAYTLPLDVTRTKSTNSTNSSNNAASKP